VVPIYQTTTGHIAEVGLLSAARCVSKSSGHFYTTGEDTPHAGEGERREEKEGDKQEDDKNKKEKNKNKEEDKIKE
jgi:hypothetical protein